MKRVLRTCGEAFLQVALVGILMFITERCGLLMVYVKIFGSFFTSAESSGLLIAVLMGSTFVANVVSYFCLKSVNFIVRAILETFIFLSTYYFISFALQGLFIIYYFPFQTYLFLQIGVILTSNLIFEVIK